MGLPHLQTGPANIFVTLTSPATDPTCTNAANPSAGFTTSQVRGPRESQRLRTGDQSYRCPGRIRPAGRDVPHAPIYLLNLTETKITGPLVTPLRFAANRNASRTNTANRTASPQRLAVRHSLATAAMPLKVRDVAGLGSGRCRPQTRSVEGTPTTTRPGKKAGQRRGGDRVRWSVEGRHQDCAIRYVEVRVGGGQTGAVVDDGRRHRERFDFGTVGVLIAHCTEAREVVLKHFVIHVGGIVLDDGDDSVGGDESARGRRCGRRCRRRRCRRRATARWSRRGRCADNPRCRRG